MTLNVTPTDSGTYYGVIADAFDDNGAFTFTFSDTSTTGKAQSAANAEAGMRTVDDFAASTSTTASVSVGGTRTGNIESNGDNDWIAAYLTAGRTYRFALSGNTGSATTLTEFINASALAAPADHYALVVWDHGGGISGVAWDDSSNSANLSLNEVSQAISGSNVTHFDIVGFDACLQGVLDQAYVLRNQADYTIASQDLEPGDGWDYTNWLSVFQQNTDPSARQVATQAVDSYEAFFRARGNNTVTLSVLNNAEVGDLATAWSSFAQAMISAGTSAMQTLRTARAASLDFQHDTYVDLHSLMTNLMQRNAVASLDTAAQNVISALGDVVLETGGLTTARGLTVYMPDTTRNSYLDGTEFPITALTGVNSFYDTYWV